MSGTYPFSVCRETVSFFNHYAFRGERPKPPRSSSRRKDIGLASFGECLRSCFAQYRFLLQLSKQAKKIPADFLCFIERDTI